MITLNIVADDIGRLVVSTLDEPGTTPAMLIEAVNLFQTLTGYNADDLARPGYDIVDAALRTSGRAFIWYRRRPDSPTQAVAVRCVKCDGIYAGRLLCPKGGLCSTEEPPTPVSFPRHMPSSDPR